VTAAYRKGLASDHHGMNAINHREFGDVLELHEKATVYTDEPVGRPTFLQVGNRHAQEMGATVGCVQPHVIPLGLYPAHLITGDKSRASGCLDRDRGERVVVRRIRMIRRASERTPKGGAQACARYRFEQIVARSDLEGANRVLLEGGDENDSRGSGEPAQDITEFDSVERRHPDINEDDIIRTFLKEAECVA
jgi:hypothetical protein